MISFADGGSSSIRILLTFWRRREAKLNRWREVFKDVAPGAFVICSPAMALIDDDEIEEVGRVFAKVRRRFAVLGWPAHEGLENGEEDTPVLRDFALLADVIRLNPDHRVVRERGE